MDLVDENVSVVLDVGHYTRPIVSPPSVSEPLWREHVCEADARLPFDNVCEGTCALLLVKAHLIGKLVMRNRHNLRYAVGAIGDQTSGPCMLVGPGAGQGDGGAKQGESNPRR